MSNIVVHVNASSVVTEKHWKDSTAKHWNDDSEKTIKWFYRKSTEMIPLKRYLSGLK